MRWILLLSLLLSTPALAQDQDPEGSSDEGSSDEGASDEGSSEEGASDQGAAEEGPSDEAPVEAAPAPWGTPVAQPAAEPPPEAVEVEEPVEAGADPEIEGVDEDVAAEVRANTERPGEARPHRRVSPRLRRAAERRGRLPLRFQLLLGGGREALQDEGLQRLGAREVVEGGRLMLEVFPHPQVGVSVAFAAPVDFGISAGGGTTDSTAELALTVGSFDVAAKAILAPQWFFLRPYVRAGGGAARVTVEADSGGSGNLATRTAEGVAGFAQVGGGLEIGTPRRAGDVEFPWSVGFYVEGGARLGGGGDQAAVPTADLGDWGKVDLGIGLFRAGVVLTF